eukprot:scaffold189287_cov21-Tisochrysis_lutea.AAC.1
MYRHCHTYPHTKSTGIAAHTHMPSTGSIQMVGSTPWLVVVVAAVLVGAHYLEGWETDQVHCFSSRISAELAKWIHITVEETSTVLAPTKSHFPGVSHPYTLQQGNADSLPGGRRNSQSQKDP